MKTPALRLTARENTVIFGFYTLPFVARYRAQESSVFAGF